MTELEHNNGVEHAMKTITFAK